MVSPILAGEFVQVYVRFRGLKKRVHDGLDFPR